MKDTAKHQGLRNQLVNTLKEKGIADKNVLEAIKKIPRHLFLNSTPIIKLFKPEPIPNKASLSPF